MNIILNFEKYTMFNESIKLFHGTKFNFIEFNNTNIGSGDGKSVHGYGFYFTNNKDIAEYYCNQLTQFNKKYIYMVKIKNDNFLDWDGVILEEDAEKIFKKYKSIENNEQLLNDMQDSLGLSEAYYGDFIMTNSLYNYLEVILESKKEASNFLNKCGFDGIKFNSKENGFNSTNYVIFNSNNIEILDSIEI